MVKKMKTGFYKAVCLMLVVMVISTCVVAGTLAKYFSTGSANATLTVATWRFRVNEETQTFPGIVELSSLSWTVESIGSAMPTENTIAPGTWGYASITVQNIGDVDAYVTVSIAGLPTESNNKLIFAVKKNEPKEVDIVNSSIESLYDKQLVVRSGKSGTNTITFYLAYKWEFGTTDDAEEDNALAGEVFEFGALTITATQVEPKKALAFSAPMPYAAYRPTSTHSEVLPDE